MKKIKIPHLFLVIFIFSTSKTYSQYITVSDNYTPQQLVQNILVNNPCAGATNVSASGFEFTNGKSYAYFSAATSDFPFSEGIILSTGRAGSAPGPNNSLLSEGPLSWLGDGDLENALQIGQSSVNATVLEFDFMPLSTKFSFEYIFASEQYLTNPTPNQCNYTDGFVFLLKEANSNNVYQNLAVIPGTSTPVRVNTVRGPGTICPAANENYFAGFNQQNHPINFNGQTVIMKAEANVTPGVLYHIKLVVADQGNNLYDSAIFLGAGSFKVEKDLGPDRLIANGNPVCLGENLLLDATEPGNNTYQWYKDNIIINGATQPTFEIQSGQNGLYSVEINYAGGSCIAKSEVIIEYSQAFTPNPAVLTGCDIYIAGSPTYNLYNATAQIINGDTTLTVTQFFEDASGTMMIPNPSTYTSVPKTIYAMVKNSFGCGVITSINLLMANNPDTSPSVFEICDIDDNQDGITNVDLNNTITTTLEGYFPQGLTFHYYENVQDAAINDNEIQGTYTTVNSFTDTIWLKVMDGNNCYIAKPLTLVINTFSPIGFEDVEKIICEEDNGIFLSVINAYDSYLWNDPNASMTNSVFVTEPGTYTVEVGNEKGCIATKKFIVTKSSKATILSLDIKDFSGINNTVEIKYSGNGDYVFSLDGIIYQNSPIFTHVVSGLYNVHVKDLNGCGIVTEEVYVLDYPRFFTPNNDGYHDIWEINYLKEKQPKSKIIIYDRFGKLLYQFVGDGTGWDGTYKGKHLKSDDYWFVISLEDNRQIKGHFSLKR